MFHKHKWKVIDKTIIPPPADKINLTDAKYVPGWMFETTVITIIECEKCGAVKEFKSSN